MIIMHIMLSMIIIYGYRPGPMTVSTRHPLPRNPLTCQRTFPARTLDADCEHKTASSSHSSDTERTQLAQVHRSHPLQNLTRISQDGERENQLESNARPVAK